MRIESEDQRWLQFFKVGEQLNEAALPDWMTTQEMKQAMSTLSSFSEKERQYFQYQARQEYLREQRALQSDKEQAKQELEQASRELLQTKLLLGALKQTTPKSHRIFFNVTAGMALNQFRASQF